MQDHRRDYRLPVDVMVRIFSDRIEIESPGLLAGPVTTANIARIGAHSRNPLLIQHLRQFPEGAEWVWGVGDAGPDRRSPVRMPVDAANGRSVFSLPRPRSSARARTSGFGAVDERPVRSVAWEFGS